MIRHIVFRCLHCRGTTSVQAEWVHRDLPAEVVCGDCNAAYQLPARRDRGASNRDYYERAQKFASENAIDLPSAYAVFEGILPRDKVRALAKPAPEASPAASTSLRTLAMFAAVVIGLAFLGSHFRDRLAPKLAVSRPGGNRDAVRMGSMRERGRPAVAPIERPVTSFVPVVLQTDASGAVTKIGGPDPRNVLMAYCQQPGVAGRLTPVTIAQTSPPAAGLRLGMLRRIDEPEALYTVRIWLDTSAGRWTIGNGLEPIQANPASVNDSPDSRSPSDTPTAALAPEQ